MDSKKENKNKNPNPSPAKRTCESFEDQSYFMAVALLIARKSPDPSTKVGACIVNKQSQIVATGYNKMPNGCENSFPWEREAPKKEDTKYPYVCHAELNAIMNKTSVDVKGCTIYVTLFPCNECAKCIIQSGIERVIYLSNKYADTVEVKISDKMLTEAHVLHSSFNLRDNLTDLLSSIKLPTE